MRPRNPGAVPQADRQTRIAHRCIRATELSSRSFFPIEETILQSFARRLPSRGWIIHNSTERVSNETARSEASDYPGVGPMDPNAAHPSRDSARPDSCKFFLELQEARSPLLDFRPRGLDKWQ